MLRQRAALAEWAPGGADGSPVRDHRQVKIVYPVSILAKSTLQDRLGGVGGHLLADKAKPLRDAMHMGVDWQCWLTQAKEQNAGGGLRADTWQSD